MRKVFRVRWRKISRNHLYLNRNKKLSKIFKNKLKLIKTLSKKSKDLEKEFLLKRINNMKK